MARKGAEVTAVDVSPEMLRHAERLEAEQPLGITYIESDAARLGDIVTPASFDMVTSCLALQDMPDVPEVLGQARRALRPGGRLVVSITHPCTFTPHQKWERDQDGAKQWLCVDRYFERGPLEYPWRGWAYEFTTPGLHAPLEDWFGWFLEAGFVLVTLREPQPSPEALNRHPDLEDAARVPYYLLLDFILPGPGPEPAI
jgi:SAM-dependent methyltransferase